jgi:hypothetical protein
MTKSVLLLGAALALTVTAAGAKSIVIDDADIQHSYDFVTRGPLHFCQFVTTIVKAPIVIKFTAAFITDDAKPKDHELTVAYIVEAFAARLDKNRKLETKQLKVENGRIISDVFRSDPYASKNVEASRAGLGATYTIPSEGSVALFMNTLAADRNYTLAVDLENNTTMVATVRPTADLLATSLRWHECGSAIMEHRPPK